VRIDQLEVLCAVVVTGSVTAAAEHLGITQPTATRRLKRLEDDLGVPLLRSEHRTVTLTAAGERTARTAAEVVGLVAELRGEISSEGPMPIRGRLRVAASTIPGEHLVPQLAAGFTAANPLVSVEVTIGSTSTVLQLLRARSAEIGFTGAVPAGPEWTVHPIAADEVVLVVPADHPLAATPVVARTALEDQAFVVREPGSATQQAVDRALAPAVGDALPHARARLALGSTQAVLAAVRAGAGIGFVSARAVAHAGDGLRALRIEGIPIHRELQLVHETDRLRLPLQDRFLAWSRSAAHRLR
jgi:DNA-binding transcriptional LysR family regulator